MSPDRFNGTSAAGESLTGDEALRILAAVLAVEAFWAFLGQFPGYGLTAGLWGTAACRTVQAVVVVGMARRAFGRRLAAVGLPYATWRRDAAIGCAAALLLGGAALAARQLWLWRVGTDLVDLVGLRARPIGGPTTAAWEAALVVGVIGPAAEDLFFWGVLFGALRRRLPAAGAALAVVLPYAALHWRGGWLSVLPPVVGGTLFAVLYAWRGSILATLPLHAAANLAMVLISRGVWLG